MNSFAWWLAVRIALLLDHEEREFVLGDLAESHSSGADALYSVAGLIVRRQLALWEDWRPWFALTGIVALVGYSLSRFFASFATGVWLQVRTYEKYGVHYGTGVTPAKDAFHLAVLGLALITWSWISGFVLMRLSGRTFWLTAPLFYVGVQDSFLTHAVLSGSLVLAHPHRLWLTLALRLIPLRPAQLLFIFFAAWGAWRGRSGRLSFSSGTFLAGLSIVLTASLFWSDLWYHAAMTRWSEGVFRPGPSFVLLLPIVLVSWPAAYLPFLSRHSKAGTSS